MARQSTGGGSGPICPGCGGTQTRPVAEARGKGGLRNDLLTRLAPGPQKAGDGCLHFLEGMVLTGIGVALAYAGTEQDKPLYLAGGVALALVCFLGTLAVVRGDRRERAAETAGAERAARVWDPAFYCHGCECVFCPGGVPWQGALTPEQFKKFVWTEAGYADQLTGPAKEASL
ncbi:hypothetical protein JW613_11110 [Streptomyces smyrnaeus]|uniref:Uncharacterized protein n=1 Tax=Streptomyces smyrnaeus TaxID=1387713 RepID=A0ABS3XTY3_9ACTN|nr:hypothetical protein [Streptomyces smyrnaeus]